MKVLITCEDQTQISVGKEALTYPLPAEVKKKVVWRDRLLSYTDEALSTYVRSAGLFAMRCTAQHGISSGIPAVVCRSMNRRRKVHVARTSA